MIDRPKYLDSIGYGLRNNPVIGLIGPRQCGKTTLARLFAQQQRIFAHFDLENSRDASRLSQPMLALENREGLVIIDEIQRKPELFETLRVLVDRPNSKAKFLVLGSASPRLVTGASESLAGRISFVDLSGLDLSEVGFERFRDLWVRGGFPRSFLAPEERVSFQWREDFIRTFLERDVPQLGISIPAETLRRFWTMVAHYHGQIWNAAELARSMGTGETTSRRYLDILSGAYMVRQLQPWFENLKKRQVKSPKVYIRDSGLLHALLSLESSESVYQHPKLGASWEGFAVEQILINSRCRNTYFWSTHSGAELDLLLFKDGKRIGFEVKYTDAARTTKSMRSAFSDLRLDKLYVVYPGRESYTLDHRIYALSILDIETLFQTSNKL